MTWWQAPPHDGAGRHARRNAGPLRRNLTEPEKRLWWHLRHTLPPEAGHFRRQVPIGPYIADFVHMGARLIIEVDGEQHGFASGAEHDARRDAYMLDQGFRTPRFSNHTVMTDMPCVIDTIVAAMPSSASGDNR